MLSKWQLMAEQARQKREGQDVAAASQPGRGPASRPSPMLGKGSGDHQEGQKRSHSAAFGTGKSVISFGHPHVSLSCTIQSAAQNRLKPRINMIIFQCSRHEKTWPGRICRSATSHLCKGCHQCPREGAPDDEITADLPAIRAVTWRFYRRLG